MGRKRREEVIKAAKELGIKGKASHDEPLGLSMDLKMKAPNVGPFLRACEEDQKN